MNIVKRHGIAAESAHLPKGMLGISVGNYYFSKERVSAIAALGAASCDEFAIVLVDHPERWNWPLKEGRTFEAHEAKVKHLSAEKRKGFRRALGQVGLEDSVPILDWQTAVGQSEAYMRNMTIMEKAYESDMSFYQDVHLQLRHNVGGKISDHETKMGRSLTINELDSLSHYLLEEIAGLSSLWLEQGYVDFYNKPTMAIVENISNGAYPEIQEAMGYDWTKYGLVEFA